MSRIAPLFKVESFQKSVRDLFSKTDADLAEMRRVSEVELTATVQPAATSVADLIKRAFNLIHEAAVRDGLQEVESELVAAFPDVEKSDLQKLVRAITPGVDDQLRLSGLDNRDAFLPILTGQRLALDLRVADSNADEPIVTPFVSARFEFDSPIAGSSSSIVFQLNLADMAGLIEALENVRGRASKLIASTSSVSIPDWGHGLPAE